MIGSLRHCTTLHNESSKIYHYYNDRRVEIMNLRDIEKLEGSFWESRNLISWF